MYITAYNRLLIGPPGTSKSMLAKRLSTILPPLDEATLELLKFAMADLNLSARAYDRVLKVGRTIAVLAGAQNISSEHIFEAIQYRSLDRQLWT